MCRTLRVFAVVGITIISLGLFAPSASAADTAQDFIQARQAEVSALLRQSQSASRDRKISTLLDRMIDYSELAQRSLATHWADLSEAQQKEFSGVLKQLVQRNYERNIKNILDYQVDYLGQESAGEDRIVLVHSKATSKTNQREDPVSIDYWMEPADDGWRIVDIITEGSSMVNNYKSQFHRIIQKDGYDALLRKMKDKLARGQAV